MSITHVSGFTIRTVLYSTYKLFPGFQYPGRYTGPPGFAAEGDEATEVIEAVLGLPRLGCAVALGATLPRRGFKRSLLRISTLSPTWTLHAFSFWTKITFFNTKKIQKVPFLYEKVIKHNFLCIELGLNPGQINFPFPAENTKIVSN